MKKILTALVLLVILVISSARAQDFLGYSMSNYSGITGAYLNPASIADSRFKFDMELVGLDFSAANNYVGISNAVFLHPKNTKSGNFQNQYLTERKSGDNKSLFVNASVHLPAFMIRLNPKNSIGFTCRARAYMTLDGLEPNLAHQVYKGLQDTIQYFQVLSNKDLRVQFNAWTEYGLTFAHVFLNKDKQFLKAGVTVKLLQGLGAAYMYVTDLQYKVSNKDTIAFFNTKAGYGHSTNFSSNGYKMVPNYGVGADLGIEYEYRPDNARYRYDMDGKTNLDMRWKNKYKLRLGLSVLDIGGIRYSKDPDGKDFSGNVNLWNLAKTNINNFHTLDSTLRSKFVSTQSANTFYMRLPTTLNFQADYGIYKDFYAGLMGVYAFQFANAPNNVHEISKIAFVPRWDHRWFGAYVPFSYDGYHNFNYGVNLRLGPLVFGTNTLKDFLGNKTVYGAEFHVLLKIPIPYHGVRDRDHDKVSDKKDKCPDVAGTWEFMGCPDRDGDHVPDSEDQCPDVAGPVELHGCPDRDGDKVIDKLDSCPDNPGPPELHGCPDRDGDKVIDKDDACPDEPGLPALKGCPDRDGDGIPDKQDNCPDKPGPADNDGCPVVTLTILDKDLNVLGKAKQSKDGTFRFASLPDDKNMIFSVDGEDTQGLNELNLLVNGVPKKLIRGNDRLFHFEQLKGDANGMSEMDENDVPIKLSMEEAKILKKAFSNLEFETGKDVIKKESFISLDELGTMLKKKPEWKLKLSGHTDNQGSREENMKLSENRARAVADYLVRKGISEKRFKLFWHGPDKPIAPNTTPQGRQKNRRVEMVIID